MLLWFGDEIEYRTPDGRVLTGKVSGVSGSRIYLQDGGVTYESYVIRQTEQIK
jgi:hypothetical protein